MELPDPLRPYLALIRLGLWCVLAGGLFVAGCRHGEQGQREANAAALSGAQQDAVDNLAAANACGQAMSDVSEQTRLAERKAAEWKQAAGAAEARAGQSRDRREEQIAAAANALEKARAKPTCAAQLEMELCPEIPLL